MIKDLKMYFECLLKHQIGECDSGSCPYCDGPHNILLCYKKENDMKRERLEKSGKEEQEGKTILHVAKQRDSSKSQLPKPSTSKENKDDWSDWEDWNPLSLKWLNKENEEWKGYFGNSKNKTNRDIRIGS